MATYFEGSSDHVHISIPMSKSSSSSSYTPTTTSLEVTIPTSPPQTSLWEELKGIENHVFLSVEIMQDIVKSQRDKFENGSSDQQYLIFKYVSSGDFVKIDDARHKIGKIRMTYYSDLHLLIVKIPSAAHEAAASNIGNEVLVELRVMGIGRYEFWSVNSQRYQAVTSSNEADIAYKPSSFRRGETAWPTLVFEVGVSESPRGLRFDARWWLRESGGDVKIVILIHIHRGQKRLHIEKWELAPAPPPLPTRANPNPAPPALRPPIPTKTREITIVPVTITPNTVAGPPFNTTGAPLTLEFHKLLLRPANPPREADIIFTAQALEDFATFFWRNVS
jgi:hypothetical protein